MLIVCFVHALWELLSSDILRGVLREEVGRCQEGRDLGNLQKRELASNNFLPGKTEAAAPFDIHVATEMILRSKASPKDREDAES